MLLIFGNASFNNALKIQETPQAFVPICDRLFIAFYLVSIRAPPRFTQLACMLIRVVTSRDVIH